MGCGGSTLFLCHVALSAMITSMENGSHHMCVVMAAMKSSRNIVPKMACMNINVHMFT